MFTREECLRRAEEAEEAREIVSYGPDKARLQAVAQQWRAQAAQAAGTQPASTAASDRSTTSS